jgi:diketogulonate reductase-like aldo/keto reductase
MSDISNVDLNNGLKMPAIGFGTWNVHDGSVITEAIKGGYRLIDTAKIYGNEQEVGKGIKKSGVDRAELFVTTKLWTTDQGYKSAHEAFEESLARLDMEYVDLYLIHWPGAGRDKYLDSWNALAEIYKSGKAKAVGVSNFSVEQLDDIIENSDVVPAVNQIEFHPFIYARQKEVLDFCHKNGIVVEAYSPLARAKDLNNTTLHSIAGRHGKTIPQIMLKWAIQHKTVPIPKSSNTARIKENLKVFDFELSDEEMNTINKIA